MSRTGEPLDDEFLRKLVDAVLLPLINHERDQQ